MRRPPSLSSLKITDRFFCYASPCLWNQLPFSLRQPHSGTSSSISYSPVSSPVTSSSSNPPLCTSITPSLFHSRLKSYLFHKYYPLYTSSSRTASMDYCQDCFFWCQFKSDCHQTWSIIPLASVSSVYLVLCVEKILITSFSLPFSVLSLCDWPLTWKTIILQCYYTVGWVI